MSTSLLDRRNAAYVQARSILESAGEDGMTPEQEQAFDAAMEEGDKLDATLTRSTKLDALKLPEPNQIGTGTASTPVEQSAEVRAFEDFMRYGLTGPGLQRDTDMSVEKRAQGVATNAAGGFLAPDTFSDQIIKARKLFGGFRALARNISTATGTDLIWPTWDTTGQVGEWIGENVAVTELDVVVGNVVLGAHKASSRLVRVSNELLQDETYNLDSELGATLGERIGRLEAPAFISGTGTGQPTGFLPGGTVGATTPAGVVVGLGTNVQAQDFLIDLEHSIDPAYRPGSAYVLNDNTLSRVRRIRDADGRALWQASLTAGLPSTINGYAVVIDQAMPTSAAGARFIAFGNWREAYIIRDVRALAVRRLNERYAEFDQVGFIAFTRVDGKVIQPLAYRVGANAAV